MRAPSLRVWSSAFVNPWDPGEDFGSAGNVASDLVDAAFESPVRP